MSITVTAAPKPVAPEPAAPLTIDFSKAAENGTIIQKDVSGSDYAGISFKLVDQLKDYTIANFDSVTFGDVDEETGERELLTTGNNLFTATLFTPWNGESASGGYGDDSDGSFPAYDSTGRLQGITAGVNAHTPGLTTKFDSTKVLALPEGIRFERNDGHKIGDGDTFYTCPQTLKAIY